LRETRVCTMADRRNPSASGQRTSQSMSKAEASALRTAWMITMAAYRLALRLVTKRRGPAFLDVQASIDQKCAGPRPDEGAHEYACDMKAPSAVSINDIPAAKISGSEISA